MLTTKVRAAFVSTNSICQGEQVITFWKYIIGRYHAVINFAYSTFVWDSEATDKAKVHFLNELAIMETAPFFGGEVYCYNDICTFVLYLEMKSLE